MSTNINITCMNEVLDEMEKILDLYNVIYDGIVSDMDDFSDVWRDQKNTTSKYAAENFKETAELIRREMAESIDILRINNNNIHRSKEY